MENNNKEHQSRTGRPTLKTPEWKHSDESFRKALMRAREQQAEVWAEEVKTPSDDKLDTHEATGRARLRMQSRQWLAGHVQLAICRQAYQGRRAGCIA